MFFVIVIHKVHNRHGPSLDWGFNLYYYGARFMDPVTVRFISPDPVKGDYRGMNNEKH
jgi:RHS repeat-associated protein